MAKALQWRWGIEFVSRWFDNIIGFGGRALPAPVAELGRWCQIHSSQLL